MKVVGLITEYNPFHNGHKYHIQKAKEITGADYAVIIMSGDYVQRGTPAIMPKRIRAEMALRCGADAVFELPVCYSTGSAEFFAEGCVSFLHQLNFVDFLCFGSESDNLNGLQAVADILAYEPDEYKFHLQDYLKEGLSFPAARQKALSHYIHNPKLLSLLDDPNNILGIEYLKALKKLNSPIQPFTILRKGAHYHTEELEDSYSSASAIRTLFTSNNDFSSIEEKLTTQVPKECIDLAKKNYKNYYPVFPNDFSLLLKYRLLEESPASLIRYMDVSEELSNRIYNHLPEFLNFNQFCELLKTKELTYTRIQRALLHILLKIKKEDLQLQIKNGYHSYARVLCFRKEAGVIISAVARCSTLPLITKLSETDVLTDFGQQVLQQNIFASNLYASVASQKYGLVLRNEYQHPVLKI